jgi:ATP-dependent RNA helicase DDX52/ROK1
VSKSARKNLKLHGVESRRAVHADDDEKTKRMKRKARIGTQSGFERREMNRKRGAIEHSLHGKGKELVDEDGKGSEDWEGFG